MGCNCGRKNLAPPAPPPMSQMPQAGLVNARNTPINPTGARAGVGGVITPKPGELYLGIQPKP